ncbi:hypothetical protein ABIB00_006344 [Bradyrhizobium sp. LB14.3]|uniref:hypothetical protein n=1 Tax=Bradyrhizobium sp. LB14.3 TaxID=3156328 RepID=UPI003398FA28
MNALTGFPIELIGFPIDQSIGLNLVDWHGFNSGTDKADSFVSLCGLHREYRFTEPGNTVRERAGGSSSRLVDVIRR